jgi:ribosomal protein S10
MGLLTWVESNVGGSRPFLKAEIVNMHLDFMDLCEGRFWGGHDFYFQLKFSIHERIVKSKDWNYQLLAPNGIHIYCKDVEEAKELAEVMYRRILDVLSEQINKKPEPEKLPEGEVAKRLNKALEASKRTTEQFNRVMWKRHCKLQKFKTEKLSAFLEKRGIVGRVWYSRLRGTVGWMFNQNGNQPILLGSNYEQALDMASSGTLDSIIQIGAAG